MNEYSHKQPDSKRIEANEENAVSEALPQRPARGVRVVFTGQHLPAAVKLL
jgi:hypothetical protein